MMIMIVQNKRCKCKIKDRIIQAKNIFQQIREIFEENINTNEFIRRA